MHLSSLAVFVLPPLRVARVAFGFGDFEKLLGWCALAPRVRLFDIIASRFGHSSSGFPADSRCKNAAASVGYREYGDVFGERQRRDSGCGRELMRRERFMQASKPRRSGARLVVGDCAHLSGKTEKALAVVRAHTGWMSRQRVLIVDDDVSIRGLVRTVLLREELEVDEAANGQEAIGQLRVKRYDVVVLDLMMGPGNGYDVLDALKIQRPGEKFVVVISATSQTSIDKLDSDIVCAKLRKPFDINDLVGAVRECTAH